VLHADDIISIDGTTGQVVVGEVELEIPDDDPRLATAAGVGRRAAHPARLRQRRHPRRRPAALAAGAEGIGLCRTEHQFLGDRLPLIQQVILSGPTRRSARRSSSSRRQQREDFEQLFEVMDGKRVVIRLLDPPLHEFLPDVEELHIKEADGRARPTRTAS
jgi:pyruvate, orthophosphate dikinase